MDTRGAVESSAEEPSAWDPDPLSSDRGAERGSRQDFLPHIVAWNLTARCNLACSHCYISAGSWRSGDEELTTADCRRIIDQILDVNPSPMLILSGGEPLLREDLEEIARYAASGGRSGTNGVASPDASPDGGNGEARGGSPAGGATVVVGTNGTRLTAERIDSLRAAGVRGVALSIDSLDPDYHDRFRRGAGALEQTLAAVERLRSGRLDFVVQTSLTRGNRHELRDLVAWAADRGAVSFNLYFLVQTGRGEGMKGLPPEENERVLEELVELQREYRGRLMIRSKCQPQLMRLVHRRDPDSPLLNYRTRCPCGVHYCRITPEGKVTPCPYLPEEAGDLAESSFGEIWRGSPLFDRLRHATPGGKCGRCAYRELCGGCRARAYARTGDVMGPDDSCAHEPPEGSERRPVIEPPRELTYGSDTERSLTWTPEAEARLERIPSFVRGVVARRLEAYAREEGRERVTVELMTEVRRNLPVDFSKRLPFFLRDGSS